MGTAAYGGLGVWGGEVGDAFCRKGEDWGGLGFWGVEECCWGGEGEGVSAGVGVGGGCDCGICAVCWMGYVRSVLFYTLPLRLTGLALGVVAGLSSQRCFVRYFQCLV